MRSYSRFGGWLALAIAGPLVSIHAQAVTIAATASAPLAIGAVVGSTLATDTWPAGPLPQNLLLLAQVPPSAAGQASSNFVFDLVPAKHTVRVRALTTSGGTASLIGASTNLIDIVLLVQATAPVLARLEVDRMIVASVGAQVPMQRIDVGNDGTFEIVETSAPGAGVANIALGPAAVPIRIVLDVGVTGTQSVEADMTLRLVADNQLTIAPVAAGCAGHGFEVAPSFVGSGVRVSAQPFFGNDLVVVVIGTGLQPVVLPAGLPGCVLLPAPEVVAVLPQASTLQVPLPPAVRPISFWVQGAVLWQSGFGAWTGELTTTTAFFVDAY